MKEIQSDAKNIRSLLHGSKFAVDYYQREYRWETKQIAELLDDLCNKFQESHEKGNERTAVNGYGRYFLGSIIVSDKDGRKFIIDGQQRLTSLSLLLIHIYRQLNQPDDEKQKETIGELICSYQVGGKYSFNLDVEDRTDCMNALFNGEEDNFDNSSQSESVGAIIDRYQDIEECFPDDLTAEVLPYFADWLIQNVYLVEITAYSDTDAYTIFETMNDRGLSLTPTDMLKGYLLANITDTDSRNSASRIWRDRVTALQNIGNGKEEDADAIKGWLRSQHAQSIRERKRGASPRDFDLIGTEFHRWVHERKYDLGLRSSSEFGRFIKEDFSFYTQWHEFIRRAAQTSTKGLEVIYYNAQNNFTLQYPVLLAPLAKSDNEEVIRRKLCIVASYLDILIARRIWNSKSTSYSNMQYNMFQLVIREIRGKSVDELVEILTNSLNAEEEGFASNERFRLHGQNRKQIHRLLARMTDFVETASGRPSHYDDYISGRGKNGYEVEHIWADHHENHTEEFSHPTDFSEYRDRIGGLLLLPKSFNASFGDMPYAEKREHYLKQNLLAQSLHENAYEHDPGFRQFRENTGLAFRAHSDFRKADLDMRQNLYLKMAEHIWNPENLRRYGDT